MEADRFGRVAGVTIAAETDGKIELQAGVKRHRRGDVVHAKPRPRVPITREHVGIDERRLDVARERLALGRRQFRHDVRNDHVEAGEHGVLGLDATRHSRAHVADAHAVAGIADVDAGRIEADAHALAVAVELGVVERREHHVVHAVAWRDVGNERAHQQTSERGVAVGEVIDIRLACGDLRQQAQAVEARIAELAGVAGRHRVASEPEEAERAALKAVRDLLAAAARSGEVIAVTRALEDFQLLLGGLAGERIARVVVEREQLRLAR